MDLKLTGRRALVNGASSGIGLAIAEGLVAEGAEVIIASRSEGRLADAVAAVKKSQPGASISALTVDLMDESSIRKLFNEAGRKGPIDILVNNTGGPAAGNSLDISLAEWDKGYQTLLRSVVLSTQLAVPQMKDRKWGRILTVTSTSAVEIIPNLPISSTMRAGLSAWVKGIAKEVGPWNILVNNLLPGPTRTARLAHLAGEAPEFFKSMESRSALRRIAEPEEMARYGVFLCSGANTFMTGTDCLVDGASTSAV